MQKQSNSGKRFGSRVFLIRAKNSNKSYYTFANDLEDLYAYIEEKGLETLDWSSLIEDGKALTEVIRLHQEYRSKTNFEEEFCPDVVYLDRKNSPFMQE